MTMKLNRAPIFAGCLGAGLALLAFSASAMTVAELRLHLEKGDKITLVDVRATEIFQKAHIAGAINVPSWLMAEKTLPPVGEVVVYDEGLGQETAQAAAAELNKKRGI